MQEGLNPALHSRRRLSSQSAHQQLKHPDGDTFFLSVQKIPLIQQAPTLLRSGDSMNEKGARGT